ncbi:zinc-binding protein A33-like isoform X2 [Protopterus annectens]|uniref:zinc-binding protein A33-like isoform X2 n=1 Tax=Protopterus annectens TaxID=7888 RepID=UPI001CFA1550|nr:zinc-binding protein A33-like isoform X2 [Protopterus annectens]
MASLLGSDYMEELNCPVCLEPFDVPVMLECGHNFCKTCINRVWDSTDNLYCPECRQQFSARKYSVNLFLANQVERVHAQIKKRDNETVSGEKEKTQNSGPKQKHTAQDCGLHTEKLKLFCAVDETLLCALCVPNHCGHRFIHVEEAANVYQEKVMEALLSLECHQKSLLKLEKTQQQEISNIKQSAQSLEQHLRSEFDKLRKLVLEKEQHLICQLRQEKAEILKKMEENIRRITDTSSNIQGQISAFQSMVGEKDNLLFLSQIKPENERYSEILKGVHVTLVNLKLREEVYRDPALLHNIWKEVEAVIKPNTQLGMAAFGGFKFGSSGSSSASSFWGFTVPSNAASFFGSAPPANAAPLFGTSQSANAASLFGFSQSTNPPSLFGSALPTKKPPFPKMS